MIYFIDSIEFLGEKLKQNELGFKVYSFDKIFTFKLCKLLNIYVALSGDESDILSIYKIEK
jgi:hypothetical protein